MRAVIRFFMAFGRFGLRLAAVATFLAGRRGGAPAAALRRLFDTLPGPEGRERTLFTVVDLAAAEDAQLAEASLEPVTAAAPAVMRVVPVLRRGAGVSRGRVKLAAAVVVALVAAGGALAYFTSAGSGFGSASVGATQDLTISAGVTPTEPLFPNGSGDLTVSISNPNEIAVRIPSLQLDTGQGTGGFGVDGGHSGCVLSTLGFTAQNNGGAGWDVPKKVGAVNGSLNLDLAAAVSMSTAAVNACQGATFTVFLKVGS